jgi:hypothetical protein
MSELRIDQGWVDALDLPREKIASLGLREFVGRCQERGITFKVTVADPPVTPGLHLKADVEEIVNDSRA